MAQSSTAFTLIILYLHINHHPPSPRSLCTISASSQSSCFGSSGTCIHFTPQNHGVRHYLSILFRLAYHAIFHLILGHPFTSTTNAFQIMAHLPILKDLPIHLDPYAPHLPSHVYTTQHLARIRTVRYIQRTLNLRSFTTFIPILFHSPRSFLWCLPRQHDTTLRLSSILFSSTYPSPFAIFLSSRLFHSDALSPVD
jgi:hypothetical protein